MGNKLTKVSDLHNVREAKVLRFEAPYNPQSRYRSPGHKTVIHIVDRWGDLNEKEPVKSRQITKCNRVAGFWENQHRAVDGLLTEGKMDDGDPNGYKLCPICAKTLDEWEKARETMERMDAALDRERKAQEDKQDEIHDQLAREQSRILLDLFAVLEKAGLNPETSGYRTSKGTDVVNELTIKAVDGKGKLSKTHTFEVNLTSVVEVK